MSEKEGERKPLIATWREGLLVVALLATLFTAADKALAAGIEFQIPFTDVHVTAALAFGEKDKLTQPLPSEVQAKLGPNMNKGAIDGNLGMNIGNVGVFVIADIRSAPSDPGFKAGIGISS